MGEPQARDSLEYLSHAFLTNQIKLCRNSASCYDQYKLIREVVDQANRFLSTVTEKNKTLDGPRPGSEINSYYELNVDFLCEPPMKEGDTGVLFMVPSKCNKVQVSLYLVRQKEKDQRFLIGSYYQFQSGSISTLSVNSMPQFSNEGQQGSDGQRVAKKQATANNLNLDYFVGAGVAKVLFSTVLVIMLMIKRDMEVYKWNFVTDIFCVPYEQIDELETNWNSTRRVPGAVFKFDEDKYREAVKNEKERIGNLKKASKKVSTIEFSKDDSDVFLALYVQEAISLFPTALRDFKSKLYKKNCSVNLIKVKGCRVCAS